MSGALTRASGLRRPRAGGPLGPRPSRCRVPSGYGPVAGAASTGALRRGPSTRAAERGLAPGRPAVAVVVGGAGAGDGDHGAGRLHHFPNAVVVGIGDEDVAAAVHGGPEGEVQHGGGGGAAVASVAVAPIAREGGDGRRHEPG